MAFHHYHRATSLEDAQQTLLSHPSNILLGGGLWIKKSNAEADTAVDLSLLGLDQINEKEDHIEVGAMVTLRDFETNPAIQKLGGGFVAHAVGQIMGVALRKLATVGGSIAAKLPFSDVITPLLTLDVTLVFYPKKEIKLADYLSSKGKNKDILTHLIIKKTPGFGFFKKVGNTALDFAQLNIAISRLNSHVAIALGSRPGVAALATQAMAYLNGCAKIGPKDIEKAAEMAVAELSFASTTFASEDYRKTLALTYVRRGLEEVLAHAS